MKTVNSKKISIRRTADIRLTSAPCDTPYFVVA
jgi:hypothetical protein